MSLPFDVSPLAAGPPQAWRHRDSRGRKAASGGLRSARANRPRTSPYASRDFSLFGVEPRRGSAVTQTPKPKLNDCIMNCKADAVMNGALGVYGSIPSPIQPIAALASLGVDLLGGGINPIGNAMGTSTYFTYSETGYPSTPGGTSMVAANMTALGYAGAASWWSSARQALSSAFGSSTMRTLLGRGEGQSLLGTSGLIGGKAIPIVGTYLAIKGGKEFYNNCVKRCHDKFD